MNVPTSDEAARSADVAAQLDAADSRHQIPEQSAPGPDPMSRVIEEHAEKTDGVDPDDLNDGQES